MTLPTDDQQSENLEFGLYLGIVQVYLGCCLGNQVPGTCIQLLCGEANYVVSKA